VKDNFLLKKNQSKVFNELSNEDAGKLIKGIFNYANTGESQLDGYLKIIFLPIKDDIDKNEENYKKRCETNRANGSRGGAPKGNNNAKKDSTNDTSELGEIEEKAKTTENNQSVEKTTENNMNNHNHIHISHITNHNQDSNKKDIRVIGEEEKEEEEQPEIITDNVPYEEIISYLNLKIGSNYRSSSKETRKHIKARFNEKYTLEDFYKVIDNMTAEWLGDEKMSRYLRPETLFGTKFESYKNRIPSNKPKTLKDISMSEIDRAIEEEKRRKANGSYG